MRIKVDYPGYWANGRCFEAVLEVLQIKPGGSIQGEREKMEWVAKPTGEQGIFEVECFTIEDAKFGKFAIPVSCARVLAPTP